MSGGFAGYFFLHYVMKSTDYSTPMRALILVGAIAAQWCRRRSRGHRHRAISAYRPLVVVTPQS